MPDIYRSLYQRNQRLNLTNDLYGIALKQGGCIFLTGSCPTPTPKIVYEKLLDCFIENNKFCSYDTGSPALKQAIQDHLMATEQVEVKASSNILITLGATTFLQQLFLFLLDEESECIVITPTFQDYFNQLLFTRTKIVEVGMKETETGWILDTDEVKKAITHKTRLILICSPNNPTGRVYTKEELAALLEIAKQHNILVVADEAYNYLTYGKEFTSLLAFTESRDNIIVARTFSKEFSMCGWRVGYAYLPTDIYSEMFHLQLSFNSVSSAIAQKAAEISLKTPEVVAETKTEIKRIKANRDLVLQYISQIGKGLRVVAPEACPYMFVSYTNNIASYDLCKDIIEKAAVIVSPGKNNGEVGEKHFCITFADDVSIIKEGMERLAKYFENNYKVEVV